MKTLKDLANQIKTTGIVTRDFTEGSRHDGNHIIFHDGKIFPISQCTLNMDSYTTNNGTVVEFIKSVTINLNK